MFCVIFRSGLDVSQWMGQLRRQLDYSINYRGQPHVEDIDELAKELVKVIIHVLQSNVDKQVKHVLIEQNVAIVAYKGVYFSTLILVLLIIPMFCYFFAKCISGYYFSAWQL